MSSVICVLPAALPIIPPGSFLRRGLFFAGLTVSLMVPSQAAISATTTTLTVGPGSSVSAGTVVTLQATVDAGGTAVTLGTVMFRDGTSVLGAAPLVGRGVMYAHGTANLKLTLGPGSHLITASYSGTSSEASQYAASASAAASVTVTLASPSSTSTVIASAGNPGAYTLSGTVAAASAMAPTGTVSFLDQSNSNLLLGSAALTAASQIDGWGSLVPVTTGASTYGVVAADLNGDGILDLVTTDYGGSTISVLLGNGDGTFRAHVDYAVGALSFGLAVGDLNGDGIPDIAVGSGSSTLVSVFLGNGDGTLRAAQTYDSGGVPEYVVIADFNGDGILDLATCAGGLGTVSVLLGNGDGTFAARQTFGASVFPDGLAMADFNHDGKPDLAVSNNPADAVSVFLGNGDGSFQLAVDYPVGTAPTNLVAVDLNADGNPDLVVCDSVGSNVSVLMGRGDGTFLPKVDYAGFNNPWGIVAADVNGDGIPDVVVSSPASQAVEVFLGKGDGTLLAAAPFATGSANYLLAVGDWNGDGVMDLAVPDISVSKVSVALGSISATATLGGVSVPGGGVHNIVASYAGDTNSDPSVSAPISLAGTPFATTTELNAAPMSGPVGQTFVLTANISPASSSGYFAGGTVTFYDGGTGIGVPVSVAGGSASISSNAFTAGMHSITATYSGDIDFTGSTTPAGTVIAVASAQSITFPAINPVSYGVAPFPLNATASSGLAVTFSVISGPGAVSGTTLTVRGVGSVVIQADQAGNASFSAAPAVRRTLVVNPATTTTALVTSAATVSVNANLTLTASVSSPGLPVPTGTLIFFDGGTQLAPVPVNSSGIAAYSTTSLAPGPHSITVVYSGDANFAASSSSGVLVTVVAAQTIAFAALNPLIYGTTPITLNATASSGLPVNFSLVSGPATLAGSTLTILAAGVVVIQADQAGNATFPPAPSVRRALTVNRAASAVVLTTSAASVLLGNSVTLTATVPSGGLRTPTGSVNFLDGSVHLGVIGLNGAGAAAVTSALTPGPHQVEAIYSGDGNFQSSAALVSVAVVVPGYTIVPNPAVLTVKLGETATSTITITPVGGFRGQLSLICGKTPQIATCSLSPTTVVLPGDDLPHTVQFTLKTTVVAASASLAGSNGFRVGGASGYAAVLAMLSPFGLIAVFSGRGLRRNGLRPVGAPGTGTVILAVAAGIALTLVFLAMFLGMTGCGGGHTGPFGQWTITTVATGAGAPHGANITLTITP